MTSDYYRRPVEEFLRPAPKTHARSAYAIEVNPWTTKGDVEAALLYRGTIVSALGDIEYRLAELSIRTSYMPEYVELREQFPFKFEKRLTYLKQVFSEGPLEPYQRFALTVLSKIEGDLEFRNIVAHARMQVLPESYISFQDVPESKGLAITLRKTPMTLSQLEVRAWKSALRSRACQMLAVKLDQLGILPPLEG